MKHNRNRKHGLRVRPLYGIEFFFSLLSFFDGILFLTALL